MDVLRINDYITHIGPMTEPLSANVIMIEAGDKLWLYDVGCGHGIAEYLNAKERNMVAVLSHFHPDHMANFDSLKLSSLYVGKNTYGYTKKGIVVEQELCLKDGDVNFRILPIASTHAKGSLALEVNSEYLFTGDAFCPKLRNGEAVLNAGLLQEAINLLESSGAIYVCESHRTNLVKEKSVILDKLKCIYEMRSKDSPYIQAGDLWKQ